MSALLPCPFCGAPGIYVDAEHGMTNAMVMCGADCEMVPTTDWHENPAEAAAKWNTRALTQPPETTPVSDPSREVLTAFAGSLDAVPFDTASAAFFSFDTTHGHARVLRRAIRELLDRVDTIRPPYKPFWENPDGPGAA